MLESWKVSVAAVGRILAQAAFFLSLIGSLVVVYYPVSVIADKNSIEKIKNQSRQQQQSSDNQRVQLVKQTPESPATGSSKNFLIKFLAAGYPILSDLDALKTIDNNSSYVTDSRGDKIYFTLDSNLQLKAREILQKNVVPWGALVAIDPKTGRILALASHSAEEPSGPDVATRSSFPAASLFKLITAAAAIEKSGMSSDNVIYYRGGNYTLGKNNFLPNPAKDRRHLTFAEALGKSVNPAFARVALKNLSSSALERYALNFGFNASLPFDGPVDVSHFERPSGDYEVARTAAGFGDVRISPLHAALITATIANEGVMMRPYVVDRIVSRDGAVKYQSKKTALRVSILRSTAKELLEMMRSTTETGTAKKQFLRVNNWFLRKSSVASKTGTLSGDNPKGVYHWFVAAVPADKPEIAIASLIIDPGNARVKSSSVGRELLEYYFRNHKHKRL